MTEQESVRKMTFDEEYKILKEESNKLFGKEIEGCEPPFANCVVRRALRCIRKLSEEIQQYQALDQRARNLLGENYDLFSCVEELKELKQKIKSRRGFYQAGYEDGLREAREGRYCGQK